MYNVRIPLIVCSSGQYSSSDRAKRRLRFRSGPVLQALAALGSQVGGLSVLLFSQDSKIQIVNPRVPSQLTWKCTDTPAKRKVVFLQGSAHFHVSWWEGSGITPPEWPGRPNSTNQHRMVATATAQPRGLNDLLSFCSLWFTGKDNDHTCLAFTKGKGQGAEA